ncbi:MAG: helix-turn-helix domain-containing protein [Kiritimatiellae bacterium]|nr:helix-turn-helix domain-containing protein [Kiritimatiellia bacterium]
MSTNFGKKLRSCRKERGLTTTAAAAALDVTQPAWNQWELGLREPKLDVLVKIANLLDCSADWLLGLKDNAAPTVTAGAGAAVAIGSHAKATSKLSTPTSLTPNCTKCPYKKKWEKMEKLMSK